MNQIKKKFRKEETDTVDQHRERPKSQNTRQRPGADIQGGPIPYKMGKGQKEGKIILKKLFIRLLNTTNYLIVVFFNHRF